MSYICGRYSNLENITLKNKLLRNIIRTLITSFLFIIVFFLGNLFLMRNLKLNYFYLLIIFLNIILLVQYLVIKIRIYSGEKIRKILIIYDNDSYDELYEFFEEINKKNTYKFIFHGIDIKIDYSEVIITKNTLTKSEEDICSTLNKNNIKISTISEWCEFNLNRIPPSTLSRYELHQSRFQNNTKSLEIRIKRFSDIFVSLCLIIFTLPVVIGVILMIKIEDSGPIFYSQLRSGFKGKSFRIYKFRSMHTKAESDGVQWAKPNDKRVTKVGNLIRKTRLDELPQLFNVLKGEMSLIGPRPERPELDDKLSTKILYYNYRYLVKPGLSGWAQVNYPYGASVEDSEKNSAMTFFT